MWEGIPHVTSFAQCNSEVEVRALLVCKTMLFSMQCYCYQYNCKYYRCYLFKFKMGIACSILHKNSFQKGEFVNQVIVKRLTWICQKQIHSCTLQIC